MDLTPILTAPVAVQIHVAAAIVAMIAGPIALYRSRRDRWHRYAGRSFAGAMFLAAVSASFIHGIRLIGPFSPIHLFVPLTLWGLWRGVSTIRAGNVALHRLIMKRLFFYALGIPLVLSFIPGRTMNHTFFEAAPTPGFVAIIAMGFIVVMWSRKAVLSATPPVRD